MARSNIGFFIALLRWVQLVLLSLLLLIGICCGEEQQSSASSVTGGNAGTVESSSSYGVDVSWPMQHREVTQLERPFGDYAQSRYLSYMYGCQRYYDSELCEEYERDRIEMNLEQPRAMHNYTSAGFAKLKAPAQVMALLTQFWHDYHGDDESELIEPWPRGNTYTNHWKSPTKIINLGNESLVGAMAVRRKIVEQVGSILEAWTGQHLTPTSLYGIRVYEQGAILAPHVDRLPLVTSAIINVAQDVDEPWILEVIDHDGNAHNITMEPGDLVLYESHSVIHGRPFSLQGRYYANVFIHFEPLGYTERHARRVAPFSENADAAARKLWQEAHRKQSKDQLKQQQRELSSGKKTQRRQIPKLPPYIQVGTPEETRWLQMYAFQRDDVVVLDSLKKKDLPTKRKHVTVHSAAATGDLERVKELAAIDRSFLFLADENGWQPIHEAARGGQTRVVEYLVSEGADINQRTNNGLGATPRWWAEQALNNDHPTVKLFQQLNAIKQGPMEEMAQANKEAGRAGEEPGSKK